MKRDHSILMVIYKAINMETAETLQEDFIFINREEDMGISGLRQAKMSYRPHHMFEVFHLKKDDIVILSGHTSRNKTLSIHSISQKELIERLYGLIDRA